MNEQEWTLLASRVEKMMRDYDSAHDIWHIRRVVRLAEILQESEGGNPEIIRPAAWLHDIADAKFHNGDEEKGLETVKQILEEFHFSGEQIHHIQHIVSHLSFRHQLRDDFKAVETTEFRIVSDADKLDAIGALGIARTFHFGGAKNNPIYDPSVPLASVSSGEEYKKYNRSTIHHFYDKLLKIKDMLYTETARQMAQERHRFMELFLDRFFKEWNL